MLRKKCRQKRVSKVLSFCFKTFNKCRDEEADIKLLYLLKLYRLKTSSDCITADLYPFNMKQANRLNEVSFYHSMSVRNFSGWEGRRKGNINGEKRTLHLLINSTTIQPVEEQTA